MTLTARLQDNSKTEPNPANPSGQIFETIVPWFYNPNIHPLEEFIRRRDGVAFLASQITASSGGFLAPVDFSPKYEPQVFLAAVSDTPQEPERCRRCYRLRLLEAARATKDRELSAFTTTLLYSRRQKHELIAEEGRLAAAQFGVQFLNEDFRVGWKEGIELGKKLNLYRQRWCGCVYGAV
jgi:predicted adenine nucleotide alpha hydrolase (AANH) superfamily ATPase